MNKDEKQEVLDKLNNKKKVELGLCPHCQSYNYERSSPDYNDDYVIMECYCNDCQNTFTEYFSLDEVKFTDTDTDGNETEIFYTESLNKDDKETIFGWAEQELEMTEDQFTNKDHHDDYKSRVRRIIKLMKGEAVKLDW